MSASFAVFDETTGAMSSVHNALWAARGAATERSAAHGQQGRFSVYERAPNHDRRIGRGDDFAGDAWHRLDDGRLRWVAVDRHQRAALAPIEGSAGFMQFKDIVGRIERCRQLLVEPPHG